MKTIALEDIIVGTILTFCENAAELGCPREAEVDMWFRELSYEDSLKVADKLIRIEKRNAERYKEDQMETNKENEVDDDNGKEITMVEMSLDLSEEAIEGVVKYALENIKNDKNALINYGVNKILEEVVMSDGDCLKDC